MELNDLCGSHVLRGIETGQKERTVFGYKETCNYVKFQLDETVYIAMENPSDGYRSYCEDLVIEDTPCKIQIPDVPVVCSMLGDNEFERNDVLVLTDFETGKIVLQVGTGNFDDYYPYCVFEWHPENLACNAIFQNEHGEDNAER